MKPNFALILSMEGIALLQRSSPGWALVGEVSPESETLAQEMAALRGMADKLAPGAATFKIVIPNDQIRYVSVPAGPADPVARKRLVEQSLDGQTPYTLDELVTDCVVSGTTLQIAAVALDTLQEADEFARGYGFTPVCFAAMPETRDYVGEPYFGTAHDLPTDIHVEPDLVPIRVSGRVTMPKDAPAPAPEEPPVAFVSRRGRDGQPAEASAETQPDTAPKATKPAAEAPAKAPTEARASLARTLTAPDKPRPMIAPRLDDGDLVPPDTDFGDGEASQPAPRRGLLAGLGAALSGMLASRKARAQDDKVLDSLSLAPGDDQEAEVMAPADDEPSVPVTPVAAPAPEPAKPEPEAPKKKSRKRKDPPEVAAPAPMPEPAPQLDPAPTPAVAGPRAAGALSAEDRKREAERLTVFGARNGATYDNGTGSAPAVLGIVLAVFVLGTVGWAAIFLNDGMSGVMGTGTDAVPEDTAESFVPPAPGEDVAADADRVVAPPAIEQAADEPADSAQDTPVEMSPAAEATEATEAEPVSPLIVTEAVEAAETAAAEPAPETTQEAPATAPDTAAAADANYAATGIWQQSPDQLDPARPAGDGATGADAGADGPPERTPQVALSALTPDPLPAPPGPPATPGRRYDMDERGLVIATPEGAETPSGVIVYRGAPPLDPPTRPGSQDDAALAPATPLPSAEPAPVVQEARAAPSIRPPIRPAAVSAEGPVTETAAADATRGQDDVALASAASLAGGVINPAARPPLVPDDARESIAAGLAAAGQIDAQTDEEEVDETAPEPQFVALRPLQRPGNMEELAAAARQTPEPPPAVVPAIPSAASVTRQATLRNAIDLSEINLIGVYGQPSDRRALVRLSNGRYRKVQVGDRIDGGRVLAIGDDSLRYQKDGRNVTLEMPKG